MSNAYVLYGGAIVVVIGLIFFIANQDKGPSIYHEFAQCLTEQGATFYGAWWCPHCTNQKTAFGDAFDYVDHIECSVLGSRKINDRCQEADIEAYPAWEFSDGSRIFGYQDMKTLATKSGCELPEEAF
jgi:hypothetical protein